VSTSATHDRHEAHARLEAIRGELASWVDAVLGSYAQILFSGSRRVGAMLLLATTLAGSTALWGLGAVSLAVATARLFRFNRDLTRVGLYSYCSLLVGLGGGELFDPTPDAFVLIALAAIASVFVTAAVHSALGQGFNLPALTLPFLMVFYLALGAARVVDVPLSWMRAGDEGLSALAWLPAWSRIYLQSLGALFFLPRVDVGLVVLLALALHSRIALLLSWLGFGLAAALVSRLILLGDGTLPFVLGYNFILTAIALGGIWFVPSVWSLLVAAGGVLICGMVSVGLVPFMTIQELPLLILPFNLTIVLLLYAMRQRMVDTRPKAVALILGTPEEHLAWHRTRVARFGATYAVRFRAPFSGRWTCTQGVDGAYTHRGPWAHAFDFEVVGSDARKFQGSGERASDYRCWRLPVLACADGTVVHIVDVIEDNPIGAPNLRENWGNLVLLHHGPGLHSLVCHLARGSVKVRPGQLVRAGEVLGLCGSSGRSPVPHLHFQLQAIGVVGAPTIPAEFNDVVGATRTGEPERLIATFVPVEGAVIRNLDVQPELQRLLGFDPGQPLEFEVSGGKRTWRESIEAEVDLFGNRVLRSQQRRASSIYGSSPPVFTIYETRGDRRSVLRLIDVALARVPFEAHEALRWSDQLESREFMPAPLRVLFDFVSLFLPKVRVAMDFRCERSGPDILVYGQSRPRFLGPTIRSEARLRHGIGLHYVELQVGKRTRVATRVIQEQAKP